jgi:hypothetical protein
VPRAGAIPSPGTSSRRNPSSRLLLAALLVALVAIGVAILLRPTPGPAGLPPVDAPDDWQVTNLVEHLHSRGLRLRAVAAYRGGSIDAGAYLTETNMEWEQLSRLRQTPEHIEEWQGTARCARDWIGEERRARLGPSCLVVGPFFLFGDPGLLQRIAEALADVEEG